MKCPNCGTEVGERSAFCLNCGAKLEYKPTLAHQTSASGKPIFAQPTPQAAADPNAPLIPDDPPQQTIPPQPMLFDMPLSSSQARRDPFADPPEPSASQGFGFGRKQPQTSTPAEAAPPRASAAFGEEQAQSNLFSPFSPFAGEQAQPSFGQTEAAPPRASAAFAGEQAQSNPFSSFIGAQAQSFPNQPEAPMPSQSFGLAGEQAQRDPFGSFGEEHAQPFPDQEEAPIPPQPQPQSQPAMMNPYRSQDGSAPQPFFEDNLAPIVSVGSWFGSLALMTVIPLVFLVLSSLSPLILPQRFAMLGSMVFSLAGALSLLIFLFVVAFGKRFNPSKRNFFKAYLLFLLLIVVLSIALGVVLAFSAVSLMDTAAGSSLMDMLPYDI